MAASGNFHGTELSSLNKQTGAHLQKKENAWRKQLETIKKHLT
jgi:hypothetical protein